MNEVASPTWPAHSYYITGSETGEMTLRQTGVYGFVYVRESDRSLMNRWKSGAPLSRAEDAIVAWYVGMLKNQQETLRGATKENAVEPETPVTSGVTRVTVADTERYITMRDMLTGVIQNNSTLVDDGDASALAEAILNEFTIEADITN